MFPWLLKLHKWFQIAQSVPYLAYQNAFFILISKFHHVGVGASHKVSFSNIQILLGTEY